MNEDCLKLTTYFGERDRTPAGLLGDELLAIYAGHGLKASILLRGAEGFGRLHHLRTDRLLSLSDDLPVVSIAVDSRQRIESMLEPILRIKRRGLITLEGAHLLSGEIGAADVPVHLAEDIKLTVFVGRRERVSGSPAFVGVCDLLYRRGIAGATVLLGVDGTSRGGRRRARFFSGNADVPTMISAIGSGAQIASILPELAGLLDDPLITLQGVRVCKRDGVLRATPHELPRTDANGLALWQKLTVYTSQSALHDGHPVNLEIIRRLLQSDAAGATSVHGIWGFHGDHGPHGDRFFQVVRHVPVVTIVIDTPERIPRSFAIIDELTRERGLVTSEMIPAMRAMSATETRGGLRLAEHTP